MKSKIKERREQRAICPFCKSPDYIYLDKEEVSQKHQFKCNSCGHIWCYGTTESIYTKLK